MPLKICETVSTVSWSFLTLIRQGPGRSPAEVAARFLREIRPDAIEDCPGEQKERLRSTDGLPANFWNRVAFVEFSNPKRIEEIGTQCRTDGTLRSTYLKLSATEYRRPAVGTS